MVGGAVCVRGWVDGGRNLGGYVDNNVKRERTQQRGRNRLYFRSDQRELGMRVQNVNSGITDCTKYGRCTVKEMLVYLEMLYWLLCVVCW